MKSITVIILCIALSTSAFAGKVVEVNNSGVMAIGKDGKVYWASKGTEFKPFAKVQGEVKAIALAINNDKAFVLGADSKVYRLFVDKEKNIMEFRFYVEVTGEVKPIDIEVSEKNLIVLLENNKVLQLKDGKLVEILTIPGKDTGDDGDDPDFPDEPGDDNGGSGDGYDDNGGF